MSDDKHVIIRTNIKGFAPTKKELEILSSINSKIFQIENLTDIDSYDSNSSIFDAEAIIISYEHVEKEIFEKLRNLRIISKMGIGVEIVDVGAATKNGVVVANCPRFCVGEIADHIMAFLLACNKRLFKWDKMIRRSAVTKKVWDDIQYERDQNSPIRISGKRLGLIGFGNIPKAVSERAKPFGLEIWAYDPYVKKEIFKKYEVKEKGIDDIFKNCEFISIGLPWTQETYHMIDKKYFNIMKPNAVFINTSRGQVVEEKDLIKALKEKQISYAGIDVFESIACYGPNVKKADSPFFDLDNVILTPHISGASVESLDEVRETSAENVIRVLTGYWPKEVEYTKNYVNHDVIPKFSLKK